MAKPRYHVSAVLRDDRDKRVDVGALWDNEYTDSKGETHQNMNLSVEEKATDGEYPKGILCVKFPDGTIVEGSELWFNCYEVKENKDGF